MQKIDRSVYATVLSSVLGFLIPLVYGMVTRFFFGMDNWPGWFGVMTLGFLFIVPFALGALTVFLASEKMRTNWVYGLFAPWLSCFIFMMVVGVFAMEAWVCVMMAAPIFTFMSSLGGAVFCLLFTLRNRLGRAPGGLLALVLLSPYLFTPLENRIPAPDLIRTVESQVIVNADAATVWQNIIRLPKIEEAERPFSLFHVAGLPRPIEAELTGEGVGSLRYGQWEDGLIFVGTITDWKPNQGFTVQLKADTRNVHSGVPLQGIGGPYFDMVDDSYVIEPVNDNQVILHLFSTYRMTTHFNFYGHWWTDAFLRDIQHHILTIVQHRSESTHVQ
jgi:hypothetical protein